MKITTFNTGRQYTAQGQRIAWQELGSCEDEAGSSHRVAFVDIDRGIDGLVMVQDGPTDAKVLAAYDAGGYTPFRWGKHDQGRYDELSKVAANAPSAG